MEAILYITSELLEPMSLTPAEFCFVFLRTYSTRFSRLFAGEFFNGKRIRRLNVPLPPTLMPAA